MCYGPEYASSTKHKLLPASYTTTVYDAHLHSDSRIEWVPSKHTSRFGRLVRMRRGRMCALDLPVKES
jgi:hypothetical protein